ncbi:hypothetical protein EVAR_48441_1 [Eumeta japonica]|uniref:Uncharacterized protein n=1 Tax=Eumeta variegata TaxID=151549 RepID=A0A4C1XQG6_EUMVA|nr:hypothetical protein EVAR_48441_1 [Eumeta japonica]
MQQEFRGGFGSLYHLASARLWWSRPGANRKLALLLTWKIVYRPSPAAADSVYLHFITRYQCVSSNLANKTLYAILREHFMSRHFVD